MGLVGHALAGERLSSPASDAERRSSSSRALTSSRPVGRRDRSTQPVAILRIARFWPSLHDRRARRLCRGTPSDGLDAFGSEGPVCSRRPSASAAVASRWPRLGVASWRVRREVDQPCGPARRGATAAGFLEYQRRVPRPDDRLA